MRLLRALLIWADALQLNVEPIFMNPSFILGCYWVWWGIRPRLEGRNPLPTPPKKRNKLGLMNPGSEGGYPSHGPAGSADLRSALQGSAFADGQAPNPGSCMENKDANYAKADEVHPLDKEMLRHPLCAASGICSAIRAVLFSLLVRGCAGGLGVETLRPLSLLGANFLTDQSRHEESSAESVSSSGSDAIREIADGRDLPDWSEFEFARA